MMRLFRSSLAAMLVVALSAPVLAQGSAPPPRPSNVFPIPQTGVNFLTGDSWEQQGQRLRLYGVQSCIRGTFFTNAAGVRQDCGEASLAVLAALVRDTRPTCSAVAQIQASASGPAVTLVICSAHIGTNTLDLGSVLIAQGFGFAAFTNQGQPVYKPYQVAEQVAQRQKTGLWAFSDFTHPNAILFQAMRSGK
ncbi:thermonuclease family protein [Labrys sp. 22185]|uniref:thermonuclease family protein n=1 Tax=Labrys sp. 22185 TaxID=3453888 RepID=UPI003F824CEB